MRYFSHPRQADCIRTYQTTPKDTREQCRSKVHCQRIRQAHPPHQYMEISNTAAVVVRSRSSRLPPYRTAWIEFNTACRELPLIPIALYLPAFPQRQTLYPAVFPAGYCQLSAQFPGDLSDIAVHSPYPGRYVPPCSCTRRRIS